MNSPIISIITSFILLLAMLCVVAYADYKIWYSRFEKYIRIIISLLLVYVIILVVANS